MGWSCTQAQTETLRAIGRATEPGKRLREPFFVETEPAAGADFGADRPLRCTLYSASGKYARAVGEFEIDGNGQIAGDGIASRCARNLALIGRNIPHE